MKKVIGSVVLYFSIALSLGAMELHDAIAEKCVLQDNFLADLPREIFKHVGTWLDSKSLSTLPCVSWTTMKAFNDFSSIDFEASGITLLKAFSYKNEHLITTFIKDGNYKVLLANAPLARRFIIWAARKGYQFIFDALRLDTRLINLMDRETNHEIALWHYLYCYKDSLLACADQGNDCDPQKEFVNVGLLKAVEDNLHALVQLFVHTPCHACLLGPITVNRAFLNAVKSRFIRVVAIILSHQRLTNSIDQASAYLAVINACKNNDFSMVEMLVYNTTIFSLLSLNWLQTTLVKIGNPQIRELFEKCIWDKEQELLVESEGQEGDCDTVFFEWMNSL